MPCHAAIVRYGARRLVARMAMPAGMLRFRAAIFASATDIAERHSHYFHCFSPSPLAFALITRHTAFFGLCAMPLSAVCQRHADAACRCRRAIRRRYFSLHAPR